MIGQFFNEGYNHCCLFCHHAVEILKPPVNKTVEIAKKIFNSLGQFAIGFCLGAVVFTCASIFQERPLGYSLDPQAIAVSAIVAGLFFGSIMAINSWKG